MKLQAACWLPSRVLIFAYEFSPPRSPLEQCSPHTLVPSCSLPFGVLPCKLVAHQKWSKCSIHGTGRDSVENALQITVVTLGAIWAVGRPSW